MDLGNHRNVVSETDVELPGGAVGRGRRLGKRLVRFFVFGCLLLVVLCVVAWRFSQPPFGDDANLTRTTRPTSSMNFGTTWSSRLFWKYYEWKRKRFPNPLTYTFAASASPGRCSIHGLLNQCMDVGGTQYLIEKNVAAGSVDFGSTNLLNGAQWIAAFERALQEDKPEWWDAEKKGFRRENLVLLRHGKRTVLVLTEATARIYEERHPELRRLAP